MDAAGPLAHLPLIKSSMQMFEGQVRGSCRTGTALSVHLDSSPAQPGFRSVGGQPHAGPAGQAHPGPGYHLHHRGVPQPLRPLRPAQFRKQAAPFSRTLVQDIIGQILDMGTTLVIFDGGEPALYPELPELVRSVDDRAISTLFTSGAGFTAELARRLKEAGLYAVNVSLDSPVAEEHDAMRGREGVFLEAMQAVKNALQAGLLVDLYVVLRRENMPHLPGVPRPGSTHGRARADLLRGGLHRPLVGSAGRRPDARRIMPIWRTSFQSARARSQDIFGSRGLQALRLLCGHAAGCT